ncbi:hypothetical protein Tco_0564150 [Tanacetum coccineum]
MNVGNAGNCPQNVGYTDKAKRKNEKLVIELMQKQETMIQKGECSSTVDHTDAKKEKQVKDNCMIQFVILHTLLKDMSKEDLTNTCFSSGFQQEFLSLIGEEIEYFAPRLFFNIDKLEKHLNEEEFNEEITMVVFKNESSRSWNDIRAEGADIRLSNEPEQMNEVQSTAHYNVFANDRQHAEQPKFINEGGVNQDAAQRLKNVIACFHQQRKDFENAKIELFKKNQFDSFSRLNVNCNISDLEKESGEKKNLFERETCVFQIKIVELEKTLAKQTKENSELLMKIDNLENAFADEVKRLTTGKLTAFDKENYDFGSKVTHLEKIIA